MGQIGMPELLIVLAIAVLIFGGKKIPELMRGVGEGVRSFKEGVRGDPPGPGASQDSPPASPEKK